MTPVRDERIPGVGRTARGRRRIDRRAWFAVGGVALLTIIAGVLAASLLGRGGVAIDPSPTAIGSVTPTPAGTTGPSATTSVTPSSSDGPSVAPTTSELPSQPGSPSPSMPSVEVEPPEGILPPGSAVEVTADGLRIRERPTTSSEVVGSVDAGDLLYVELSNLSLGPIRADGFDWYYVSHEPGYDGWPTYPDGQRPGARGWAAVESASERFVRLAPPRCPEAAIGMDAMVQLTPYERVACFGDQELTLDGTYGCPYCDSLVNLGTWEPGWLASYYPDAFQIFVPSWADYPPFPGSITLRAPPDVPALTVELRGEVLRVTGHFNDSRSSDCVIVWGEDAPAPPEGSDQDRAAEWYCRAQFVVTSWESIGTDPAFAPLEPG
jgi:hypothetical protein